MNRNHRTRLSSPRPLSFSVLTLLTLLALPTLNFQLSTVRAQGTGFTYQGRLIDNGSPANGNYDLRFNALDAAAAGNQAR